jgi:putative tricarboxylic transport membrane protein
LGIWFYAGTFPALPEGYPGPALFPRWVAAGLILSGLGLVIGNIKQLPHLKKAAASVRIDTAALGYLALGAGLAALYPLLQEWLGFVPTVSLLSFGVAYALKARPIPALATAVAGTVLIYWLFTGLLGVPL